MSSGPRVYLVRLCCARAQVDRVDVDEMYPMLALAWRRLHQWPEALAVLAEGWARQGAVQAALDRHAPLWHMHALDATVAKVPLRRARLLAAQATVSGSKSSAGGKPPELRYCLLAYA